MKKLILCVLFCANALGMGKKRPREDFEKDSPTTLVSSSSASILKISEPFHGLCTVFNYISRNFCNRQFDSLTEFKLHLKTVHMRLPKDYKQLYSINPRVQHAKR